MGIETVLVGALVAGAAAGPAVGLAAGAVGLGVSAYEAHQDRKDQRRAAALLPASIEAGGGADYPPVPSLVDPSIWAAGTPAARRTPPASGQPQGLAWAQPRMAAWMPGLIGRPG